MKEVGPIVAAEFSGAFGLHRRDSFRVYRSVKRYEPFSALTEKRKVWEDMLQALERLGQREAEILLLGKMTASAEILRRKLTQTGVVFCFQNKVV